MMIQQTLKAFTELETMKVHSLLATRVAYMMGRKFEEGDWADVYCTAKGIPNHGWSNLNIDITYKNHGIEHKMYCYRSGINILDACGQTFMHPAATRSIRVPSLDSEPNKAMKDILSQYADFLCQREQKVLEEAPTYAEADMRSGWLLWQESLRGFLYFEERTRIPNPDDYFAEWVVHPPKGVRKGSKNLWIYEKETGKKRYSITTEAGAKIQPYFDVPNPQDTNLYHFIVIGEAITDEVIRLWVTESTYLNLLTVAGKDMGTETISALILKVTDYISKTDYVENYIYEKARALTLTREAYVALKGAIPGVNDDHSIRVLIDFIRESR